MYNFQRNKVNKYKKILLITNHGFLESSMVKNETVHWLSSSTRQVTVIYRYRYVSYR